MAFPLDFFESFEAGTKGNFDSETDTGNRLDFPHAKDIAPVMPYRGAYCMRVNLGKNSSDAYLEEGISWASSTKKYGRFRLFVGKDVQFGNDLDSVRILQFYSAGPVKETSLYLARLEPYGIVLATINETGDIWANKFISCQKVTPNTWTTVEFVESVNATNGGIAAILDGKTQLISMQDTMATNTIMRLGAIDQSGDIQGTLYFDDFAIDDARLYDDDSAHNGALSGGSMLFVQSGFAFLGAGTIDQAILIDGGSGNCTVKIYDTDDPAALPMGSLRESLATTVASTTNRSLVHGFKVHRGAYVELAGTNPQAIVRLGAVASDHAA